MELVAPISIAPEAIFYIGNIIVTNSMLTALIVSVLLAVFLLLISSKISLIPKGLVNFVEFILEGLYNLCISVVGEKKARSFFPLIATIFLFILTSNYFGLLPGNGPLYVAEQHETVEATTAPMNSTTDEELELAPAVQNLDKAITSTEEKQMQSVPAKEENTTQASEKIEKIPIFRSPTADLNTTFALAVFAVFLIQFWGFKILKTGYIKKFINFSSPINFFIGILEIIAEISKIVSFSFRLFGNVFAGEVLLIVIASLTGMAFGLGTLPFLGLEIFVGFIQALVFAMLTLVFLQVATSDH